MSATVDGLRESGALEWLRTPYAGALAVALLAVLPLASGAGTPFYVVVLIEVFVFAIFAMGFNVLTGYTGYVSFGHVLFLGSGAYGTVLLMTEGGMGFLPARSRWRGRRCWHSSSRSSRSAGRASTSR